RPSPDPRRGIPAAPHRLKLSRHDTSKDPAGVAAPGMSVREAPGPKKSQTSGEPMNDQENQETQGSGQVVAEVQQEAPATSETTAVDQHVQASEDNAPEVQASSQPEETPQASEAPASNQPGEDPQAVGEAPAAEPATAPAAQGSQDFGQILAEFEQQSAPKKEKEPKESKGPQRVSGKILSIGEEWIFVDLGGKAEGRIAAAELKDAEGNLTVKEGDSLDATV